MGFRSIIHKQFLPSFILEVFQLFSIYARKNAYVFTYRVVPLIKISIFKKLILFFRKIQC